MSTEIVKTPRLIKCLKCNNKLIKERVIPPKFIPDWERYDYDEIIVTDINYQAILNCFTCQLTYCIFHFMSVNITVGKINEAGSFVKCVCHEISVDKFKIDNKNTYCRELGTVECYVKFMLPQFEIDCNKETISNEVRENSELIGYDESNNLELERLRKRVLELEKRLNK